MAKLTFNEWLQIVTEGKPYELHCIDHELTEKLRKKQFREARRPNLSKQIGDERDMHP